MLRLAENMEIELNDLIREMASDAVRDLDPRLVRTVDRYREDLDAELFGASSWETTS